jgi:hypothetical protein
MELTRDAIYKIYKTIKNLDSRKYNKYFLLACSNNKKILESYVESIEKRANEIYSPNFIAFQKLYEPLIREYQVNPTTELSDKINSLVNENKETIEAYQKKDLEFSVWIKEFVEIEIKQISFDHVPDELEKDVFDSLVVLFQEP